MKRLSRSKRTVKSVLPQVVRSVCRAVDSPRSLAVWLLYSSNEHTQLLDLKIDPAMYTNADEFGDDYLVTKFLSKYPHLETGIDTSAVAVRTFKECEAQCRETNWRVTRNPERAHESILDTARKIIQSILPDLSDDNDRSRTLERIFADATWGPGVTSSVKGGHVSVYNKLQGNLDATADLIELGIASMVMSIPAWGAFHSSANPAKAVTVTKVSGNSICFVPKNAKTDRPIAVEPHLNSMVQLGIGKQFRRAVRKLGINLNSQERNQHLAYIGSKFGTLATLDLKSASDTVSTAIVDKLLPPLWGRLLSAVRSHNYRLDGSWHHYYKHSSMGNGYTFELETLIFAAISHAVCQKLGLPVDQVSVYGDDIIVPVDAYTTLVEVLQYAGFTTNSEKSFSSGPFRESCGHDYFGGSNVRPFFVKEEITSHESVYRLANAINDYAHRRCSGMGRDGRFFDAWRALYLSVPEAARHRCPYGQGDSGFAGDFDECAKNITARWCRDTHRVSYRSKGLVFKPLGQVKSNEHVTVLSALWDMGRCEADPNPWSQDVPCPDSIRTPLDRSSYDVRAVGGWYERALVYYEWPNRGAWLSQV